jgi:UDP-glucose 4-epimerase
VSDVVNAVLFANNLEGIGFETFNVATTDYLKVSEIAKLAIDIVGIPQSKISISYQPKDRGWKGDVPVVRLDSSKIRQLGWSNKFSSRVAMNMALKSLWENPSVNLQKN